MSNPNVKCIDRLWTAIRMDTLLMLGATDTPAPNLLWTAIRIDTLAAAIKALQATAEDAEALANDMSEMPDASGTVSSRFKSLVFCLELPYTQLLKAAKGETAPVTATAPTSAAVSGGPSHTTQTIKTSPAPSSAQEAPTSAAVSGGPSHTTQTIKTAPAPSSAQENKPESPATPGMPGFRWKLAGM